MRVQVLAAALALCSAGVSAGRQPGGLGDIVWPSRQYQALQAALDAAPDGGTVTIAPGVHQLTQPLFIRHKRLTINGAGSGRPENGNGNARLVSQLAGPDPQAATDQNGNLVPVEDVVGMFNLLGSDVVVSGLGLSGFDAALVSRSDPNFRQASLKVTDALITRTGRGIVALGGALSARDVTIRGTGWHGIVGKGATASVRSSFIGSPKAAGLYFEDAYAVVADTVVAGASEGGLVLFHSSGFIVDSVFALNHRFGIVVVEATAVPYFHGNLISGTLPRAFDGAEGDGFALALSSATLLSNSIVNSARAGLSNWGGDAALTDTTIQCTAFDMDAETLAGKDAAFEDDGGNVCGCPTATGTCRASTSSLSPIKIVGS